MLHTQFGIFDVEWAVVWGAQSLAREAIGEYAALAEARGLTPTQLALAWVQSRWFTACTIIGATSLEQLKVPPPLPIPFSVVFLATFLHRASPAPSKT